MDTKMTNNNEEIEIDLKRLGRALLRKSWLVGIVAVVCAVCTLLFTVCFITPKYQSSAMFYVNNSSSRGENVSGITSADISASRGLVKSYIAILNTRETMDAIGKYAGVGYTNVELMSMISAESVDSTEIFQVVVTAEDAVEAQKIADAVTNVLPDRISSIIDGSSAKVVAAAVPPLSPSSPNYSKNTIIGLLVGFVLAAAVVVLRALMDVTIHTPEDLTQLCEYPILAEVPDMTASSGDGAYYGLGTKKTKSGKYTMKDHRPAELIGAGISFSAAEAYKLLRTKLQFSFADENESHVIGICSAISGEGKSLTAVNLAYSAAQLGKSVLLVDCDMRRPSIIKKLPVSLASGLSNFLSGQTQTSNLIQMCGLKGEEQAFHVISSGRIPPNPVELLSSERMRKMLEYLRTKYEYIILDLPPVGEVSDALAVAGHTDGMILVVRQNHCDRAGLSDAVRQFEFVGSRILGVVFNGTTEASTYYSNGGSEYYRAGRSTTKQPGPKSVRK